MTFIILIHNHTILIWYPLLIFLYYLLNNILHLITLQKDQHTPNTWESGLNQCKALPLNLCSIWNVTIAPITSIYLVILLKTTWDYSISMELPLQLWLKLHMSFKVSYHTCRHEPYHKAGLSVPICRFLSENENNLSPMDG